MSKLEELMALADNYALMSGDEDRISETGCSLVNELRSELQDALKAVVEDAERYERYRWLTSVKCNSLSLSRDDDHACNYMTASDWIDDHPDWFADDDPAEVERMRATNTIWRLQIYPNTPIGSNSWNASTADAAIDAARKP